MAYIDFNDEFRKLIEGRFTSYVGIEYPTLPIQYDGVPFEQPKSDPWVAISIMENPQKKVTIGRNYILRSTGYIQIDATQVKEQTSGIVSLKKIANKVANQFANETFKSPYVVANFDAKHLTDMSSKSHNRATVRVFFYYDGNESKPLG